MQTRRFVRTMDEAFGPYTSDELLPMPEKKTTPRWVRFFQKLLGVNK